jgi:hypothetical protein
MSTPHFVVHAVKIDGDVAVVDGRHCEGVLKPGHLFSRSFPCVDAWRKKESGVPCAAVVQRIEAYRHQFDELSTGMTARLSLTGSHLSAVKPQCVIE